MKDNTVLREFLSKTLAAQNVPEPVSLDSLKNKMKASSVDTQTKDSKSSRDRAASPQDMNKLKDLISTTTAVQTEKTEIKKEDTTTSAKAAPSSKATPKDGQGVEVKEEVKKVPEPSLTKGNIKEVPEDILRKILE